MKFSKFLKSILAKATATFSVSLIFAGPLHAETYAFGVLNQRTLTLTAQYWNPILGYIKDRTGVNLVLRMGKNTAETDAETRRGAYDFLYSNHVIFTPENDRAGYRAILRPAEEAIQGQIVVGQDSPFHKLSDLEGQTVGFPSKSAFVAYKVTADQLARQRIQYVPAFGANQEGVMMQLKSGAIAAASVNSQIMRDFASSRNFPYRILWSSPNYLNIPIAVHPRVPEPVVQRVRDALASMDKTAEGRAILETSAAVIKQAPPYGFRAADNSDYESYTQFYQNTVLKDAKP